MQRIRPRIALRCLPLVALGLLLPAYGCGDNGAPMYPPGLPMGEGEGMILTRLAHWPSGGAGMTVRLEDPEGWPATTDLGAAITARWSDDTPVDIAVRHRPPDPERGYLAVLIVPDTDAAAHGEALAAIEALIRRRPAGERIALYRWGRRVEQLANFTTYRDTLAEVLARVPAIDPAGDPAVALIDGDTALQAVSYEARRVGNDETRGLRSVIVVGSALPDAAPDSSRQWVLVHWAIGELAPADISALGAGRAVPWTEYGGVGGALAEVEARIASFGAGFYDLGVCGVSDTGRRVALNVADADHHMSLTIAAGPPEDRAGSNPGAPDAVPSCDPQRIVDEPRPLPAAIEFSFTPEQRAAYDQRVAGNSNADFDLSVRLWADGPAVPAQAHLRGRGSLGCERRNYTLDLDGPQRRHLLPDSATDEFYLISMCLDDRYVRTYTVYQLLAELGLFPPRFRFIELRLDGETRGVYLLIEKVKEALVSENGRVQTVLRRTFAADATSVEVKYTTTTDQQAGDEYHQLLASLSALSGQELATAMDFAMDTRGYMTLLAGYSLLQNGDHVDETWLAGSERMRSDGSIGAWYTFMGWDPDDIFNGCHYAGGYAYPDEFSLSYCAEAEIDDLILGEPLLYARYVDILDGLLTTIDEPAFQAALDRTGEALLEYLRRPEIAGAMVELIAANPDAGDPAVAETEVTAALATLAARFRARRELLLGRVADYRAQP